MARPRKYSWKQLEAAVEDYFDGITRMVTRTEPVDSGERDDHGHVIYDYVPIINKKGEKIQAEEYVIPPSVGGLCRHLGIHRSTWAEYCDEKLHPEFSDTTTRARGRMRAYLEQELLTREGKNVRGIIFDLQANYGLAEKKQIELGERATKAVTATAMPMSEKRALLEEIAREFRSDEGVSMDD